MSSPSTPRRGRTTAEPSAPALYAEILYDRRLERRAFDRLACADGAGCRRALGALLAGIDLESGGPRSLQAVQLLLDILHEVNRRMNPSPEREAIYLANRARLIEQFTSGEFAHAARKRFLRSLNSLLAPLRATHPLVARAKRYIETHYHRRLYLSSVAGVLNISPNYLSRLFRRETGGTLTAYVQRTRLQRARLLLAEGERSISEIAYRVGYQNYRDFHRNFVKYEKVSPRHMRRRLASAGGPGTRRPGSS